MTAYYLAALLCQGHAQGQEGTVTSVAIQQAGHSDPLDDVIVEFKHDDIGRRLSLQVKRKITISAANSNRDFRDIIGRSLARRTALDFQPDLDRYGFAVEDVATAAFSDLRRLIQWAISSPTANEFAARFAKGGSASSTARTLRDKLSCLIGPQSPDDEARFYRQFAALRLDGLMESGALRAAVFNQLRDLVAEEGHEILLFDRLCRIARDGASAARKWTRNTLLRQLKGIVRLRVAPNYRGDVQRLASYSTACMAAISDNIEGFRVKRPAIEEDVRRRLAQCRIVNISGLPGCGKSSILKRVANKRANHGPILFLKSDRLHGSDWLTFAVSIGVKHHRIPDLLTEIGTAGTPTLFVDGIDRIRPDQRGIIIDIVRAIEESDDLSNWKVLASSRNQGLEAYRAWFPETFCHSGGIADVLVKQFSDAETASLARAKPELSGLLMGSPSVREIARRPFFACVLARGVTQDASAPQTEVDLINAWWGGGGHDAPAESVPQRQRALLDLAEKGVRDLGRDIGVRALTDATIAQIGALDEDDIIRKREEGVLYSFAHDIYFEWVFFRLLVEQGSNWIRTLRDTAEPPLLGRVVGLLAQHAMLSPGKWTDGVNRLATQTLRAQWYREWLTAPPLSASFKNGLNEYHSLLSKNNYELLDKVLVWFQALHTTPNPILLMQATGEEEASDRERWAYTIGWPADSYGWARFLDWLFGLASNLPVRLIPKVVEVFSVWQYAFGAVVNARSEKILEFCENWLVDLEGQAAGADELGSWRKLGREARSNLATAMRSIVLFSAKVYSGRARDLLKRAIDSEVVRREAYSDLVGFTSIVAGVASDLIVSLGKAEVMTELPQDRTRREDREERERWEQWHRVLAIPDADRTSEQRREAEHMPFVRGVERASLDDVGVAKFHAFYYPPSYMREPFRGLFANDQEAALGLVRDLANHATRGWRQVHDIDRIGRGTPIPVVVEFPWGSQEFWGDWHVYSWFMGHLAAPPLECAFLSLGNWAFRQIESGRDTDEIIREIVEGNDCYAVLGLSMVVALQTSQLTNTTLAIATCQRLWHHDIRRVSQEPDWGRDWFGLSGGSSGVAQQGDGGICLDMRLSRCRDVRSLAKAFALGNDRELGRRFKEALSRFPDELPYLTEENRSDEKTTAWLGDCAAWFAPMGDPVNYRSQECEEGHQVLYHDPVKPTTREVAKATEAATYLGEATRLSWAANSITDGALTDGMNLIEAVLWARERDAVEMFRKRQEIGAHTIQSAISAIAACVIQFGAPSADELQWARDVMVRIARMEEPADTFWGSEIPWHPIRFLISTLGYLRETNDSDRDPARQLMHLSIHPREEIRKLAFEKLLGDGDPGVAWAAARLAIGFAIVYRPKIGRSGAVDNTVNEKRRRKCLRETLRSLDIDAAAKPISMPDAWCESRVNDSERDDRVYVDPNPSFNAAFAATVLGYMPVEAWCQSDVYKPLVETMLKGLVKWTSERLMLARSDDRRRSSDAGSELVEWNSRLGGLLARVAPYFEAEMVRDDLIGPFLAPNDNGLTVLVTFASSVVARPFARCRASAAEYVGDT